MGQISYLLTPNFSLWEPKRIINNQPLLLPRLTDQPPPWRITRFLTFPQHIFCRRDSSPHPPHPTPTSLTLAPFCHFLPASAQTSGALHRIGRGSCARCVCVCEVDPPWKNDSLCLLTASQPVTHTHPVARAVPGCSAPATFWNICGVQGLDSLSFHFIPQFLRNLAPYE